MSSFLWLLLYLAPLLGLTAAIFGWLGWRWRGTDLQQRIAELTAQLGLAQTAQRGAEAKLAAAEENALLSIPAELQGPDPREAELEALREEIKTARAEARLRQDEAAKAHEAARAVEMEMTRLSTELEQARAVEAEMTRLLTELEQARAERGRAEAELTALRSAPPAAAVTAPTPAAMETAKPKRKRGAAAKPKGSAAAAGSTAPLREKITALESDLVKHQTSLTALTQEREDWQRQIAKLEAKAPADPTALGLARRSLADSEKRLVAATTEIERLQNQTRVLLRVEAAAAELAEVPDDDLTQIKGIKGVISEQLRAHGIRTWKQIALWDEAEQRAFSELLAFKNRATREQWQEQARALHEAAHGLLI